MNYQRHYDLLVDKYGTWLKPKDVYTERHRKLPGYLGGEYIKGNAFYMSARAHYVAHILWAKITRHGKAWSAVKLLSEKLERRSSRLYETARIAHSKSISESLKGKKRPYHAIEKMLLMSKGNSYTLGKKHSLETKKKISDKHKANSKVDGYIHPLKGRKLSIESIAKRKVTFRLCVELGYISPLKGKPKSPEHAAKIRIAAHGTKYRCVDCDMITTKGPLGNHQKSTGHTGRERIA